MRFSEAWLREWVNPQIDTQTLVEQLTMAGLEVDALEAAAPPFTDVVVGHVLSVEPHPDAKKLRVCRVDVAGDADLGIVCGAANVAAGQRVPVACVGAELPGGQAIKRTTLRGVESAGMICSAAELGLAESSDGIWVLPTDAPVGMPLRDWLALDDQSIEIDLTPDRGDCLSIAGIAREIGVINRAAVAAPRIQPVPPTHDDRLAVSLEAPTACPRYLCRILRGIRTDVATPLWMQERLRRSGLRSLGPVVDVTNYVLLELGQPMHGFDLASLEGGIRVRLATTGERLRLLNDDEIELADDLLVIADETRPLALAGIMGGSDSAVNADTTDVLLESAFFAPAALSGKARRYGLHTDSSHRFERGVDPHGQARALERATELLRAIVGGETGPIVDASAQDALPPARTLVLRRERIRAVLGLALDDDAYVDILTRLGMNLEPVAEGWRVAVPSHRFDLLREVDLIAEIGRIHGYQKVPIAHSASAGETRAPAETAFDLDRAKSVLVARGYREVITYSFVNPELERAIAPDRTALALANPISADMSVMRTSSWPGLIQCMRQNRARQSERIRIFESGLVFRSNGEATLEGIDQSAVIGGLVMGGVLPEQWGEKTRGSDFFDVKSDIEAILSLTGAAERFRFAPGEHPALHPGQCARIERDGRPAGFVGMLHPGVAGELDIGDDIYLFELELGELEGVLPSFEAISKFPSIRRDLALDIDRDIDYQRVRDVIQGTDTDLIRNVVLFDVYSGKNIDSGRKSFALGLILQAYSRTLVDTEVDECIASVLERLNTQLGARLRE